ncbi:aKG-HExxH-type peptide beta-hydroxylase [Lentzea sp. NPDC051213]|uniref:aKG-HExxH-type peptide beta-hydroxylase n=1 Tax=Lentzea sp. NPDC051213 TaxID=3364126 RepID=UPI00379B8F3D
MGSPAASTHVLHAAIAPAHALVDERRALYRLAADLFVPGAGLSDNLLDHPIVRYEIGRALAGHGDVDLALLHRVAAMRVRDAGVAVAADPLAADLLEAPLRIIAPPGASPRPLTEADGERFEAAAKIVADGVRLFRRLAPEMADDLLAHVSMLAVLKAETAGGVVSASSRYVPGIVLIEEPSTAIEVAEALVHEGAHEKFFDLAITREFLDAHAEEVEHFETSWSHARWPLEQTLAAWHAYSCLAQFSRACTSEVLGPISLLPKARERADEIGGWLVGHETDLRADARWLLHALGGGCGGVRSDVDSPAPIAGIREDGRFRVRPDVRYRRAVTGRVVAARVAHQPEIFWLDPDAGWLLGCLGHDRPALPFGAVLTRAVEEWAVDPGVAGSRLKTALGPLVESLIVERAS